MSDLRTQLLSTSGQKTPFEQKFDSQQIKNLQVEFSCFIDKLSVIADSETNFKTSEVKTLQAECNQKQQQLKDLLIQLEKVFFRFVNFKQMTRGIEQRNKIKKLQNLYQQESERFTSLYKQVLSSCTEETKQQLKISSQVGVYFEKFDDQGRLKEKGFQNDQKQIEIQGIQLEHIDWQNQIIRERKQDIDLIEEKSIQMQNIVIDIAKEVDSQDQDLDIISDQMLSAKKNVAATTEQIIKARENSQTSSKKYICLAICAFVTAGIIIASLILFN